MKSLIPIMRMFALISLVGICAIYGQDANIYFGPWGVKGSCRTTQDSLNLVGTEPNFAFGWAGSEAGVLWLRDQICDPHGIRWAQGGLYAREYPADSAPDSDTMKVWKAWVDQGIGKWADYWKGHPGCWGVIVAEEDPAVYNPAYYPGTQYVCGKIKEHDTLFMTMGQGSIRHIHFPAIFDSCPDLDVLGFSHYWFRGNSPYSDQEAIQKFVDYSKQCNDSMRLPENLNRSKPMEWYAIIQTHREYREFPYGDTTIPEELWGKKYRLFRRPLAEEIRCQRFLSLVYGAKGVIYYTYHSDTLPPDPDLPNPADEYWFPYYERIKNAGLVDLNRLPYDQDHHPLDTTYSSVKWLNKDLKVVGPVFVGLDWNTATSVKTLWGSGVWDTGLSYVKEVKWTKKPENQSDTLYAELGLFDESYTDPGDKKEKRRDYMLLVNRHCLADDSVKWAVELDKDSFPGDNWWVVDMRNYRYKILQADDGSWKFDHSEWWWGPYIGGKEAPAVRPGDGRLYCFVNELPWDVKVRVVPIPVPKYSIPQFYIISQCRGELFKNGPRRRDVKFIKRYVYWHNRKCPDGFLDYMDSTGVQNWGFVEELGDYCYTDTLRWGPEVVPIPPHVVYYHVVVEAYNRWGECIGSTACGFKVNFPKSRFPKITAYPCQKKPDDPEGVFHIVGTGGMEDTIAWYTRFLPGDSSMIDTLGIGKFPTIVVKHGEPLDTLGVAWLSKGGDTIYYSLRTDSLWQKPYPLVGSLEPDKYSVPRMALGPGDTVHLTFVGKEDAGGRLKGIEWIKGVEGLGGGLTLYYGRFGMLEPGNLVIEPVSSWTPADPSGPIDSLGAGVAVDFFGNPYLGWAEENLVRYGMGTDSGFIVKTLKIFPYKPPEPCVIQMDAYNVGVGWVDGNALVRSYFYITDTTEVFRDTIWLGSSPKNLTGKGSFVVFEDGDDVFVSLWDAVEEEWSLPETLSIDTLPARYPQVEADQFVDDMGEPHPARFVVWTQKIEDTLYELSGDLHRYAHVGEYGVTPHCYLQLGGESPTPFTRYRDGWITQGKGGGIQQDYGLDSLVYYLPYIEPGGVYRLFLESYAVGNDTLRVGLIVNGEMLNDLIWLYPGLLTRFFEFLPQDLLGTGDLEIKLARLEGSYVPCARLILTRFELEEGGGKPGSGGPQGASVTRIPLVYLLYQNQPNPCRDQTHIRFQVPKPTRVSLKLYDVSGRLVRVLIDSKTQNLKPGTYDLIWDGRDDRGMGLASGVYFYRFETEDFSAAKKLVLLR